MRSILSGFKKRSRSIDRVIFTGDFLRCTQFEIQNKLLNQTSNVMWLRDLLEPTLSGVTKAKVEVVFPYMTEKAPDVSKIYQLLGLEPGLNSWAKTYWTYPSNEFCTYLEYYFRGGIVLLPEISPLLAQAFDKLGIPWIQVGISPLRFLQDLVVTIRASDSFELNTLAEGALTDHDIKASVGNIRSYYSKFRGDLSFLDDSVVFFSQTEFDRSTIFGNSFFDDGLALEEIQNSLQGRKLLIVPHPLRKDSELIKRCERDLQGRKLDLPTYQILSSGRSFEVITISSSVAVEARCFNLRSTEFNKSMVDWMRRNTCNSKTLHSSRSFWASVLSKYLDVQQDRKSDYQQWIPNKLRKNLGNWGIDPQIWSREGDESDHFYHLDRDDRIRITNSAINSKSTVVERWEKLEGEPTGGWNQRASVAGSFLASCASVADLGCGKMSLESHLSLDTNYIPADVVMRDNRTTLIDFNSTPKVPESAFAEGCACLGLIEYIHDVPRLLVELSCTYRKIVISYNIQSGGSVDDRLEHAWVNNFSLEEVESLFSKSGLIILKRQHLQGDQYIWLLEPHSTSFISKQKPGVIP